MLRNFKILVILLLWQGTALATIKKGYIPAGRLKLYYVSQGNGPAVILLHGGYLDLHSWDRQAIALAAKFRVVRFDLPGHGETTGIDTALKIQEVIRILMDSLHIQKASLIGLSLGGACVADFAVAYPERVNKLVFTSAGLSGWPDVIQLDSLSKRLFNWSDSVFMTKNHRLITACFTHLWCDGPYRSPSQVSPLVRRYIYRTVAINDVRNDDTWPVFNTERAAKRVQTISAPVLILAGEKDMPFILAVAKYLHRQIKGSKMHIVSGVAHMINLEKPERYNRFILAFLKE